MVPPTAVTEPDDPELEQTAWDLEPLVDGEGEEGVQSRLEQALDARAGVRRALRGQLERARQRGAGGGDGGARRDLRARRARRLLRRAALLHRHRRPRRRRAARRRCRSARRRSRRRCCSSSSSGPRSSDERVEELLAGDGLDFCRHYLRNARRYRAHLLSEPEERILTEKALTGASAWSRLFEELTSAIEVELPSEQARAVALDVALAT